MKANSEIANILERYDDKNLSNSIRRVVESINQNMWNKAKSIWIIDVCNVTPTRRVFDCNDCEFEKFIRFVNDMQMYKLVCANNW